MTINDSKNLSLGEAAGRFMANLSPEERETSQQEVYRFVRWFSAERSLSALTAPGVANYAEQLSLSDTDYDHKLDMIRTFLAHAKKQGWYKTNLATHLKAKKTKTRSTASTRKVLANTITLTRQGHAEMEAELAVLKKRSLELIDEIRKAAADKDFRENAPLAAAREERGHVEGRVIELEKTLRVATILDEGQKDIMKAGIGSNVVLCDLASGEELCCMIVDPREVDPARGKISCVSPIGKAIVGRAAGEVVEVAVPAGKLRYQVKRIER